MALDIAIINSARAAKAGATKAKSKTPRNMTINLFQRKVSTQDRMFFTEQLALMLATGTSLHPALVSIAKQMPNNPLQHIIEAIADGAMNGRSLSEELGRYPEVFSPMYVNLVAASESGGFLHEVLEQLCSIEEQNDELRATLISAFSYPAFLVAFSIFTLAFVLLVVFPKFTDLFVAIGDQLPVTTKVLMATSSFLLSNWLVFLIGVGASIFALGIWLKTSSGKAFTDTTKLKAPFISRVWQQVYVVLMLRVLGLSLQHGVSLVDAVRTSREIINNGIVQRFLTDLSGTLEQGGRLSQGFNNADWLPELAKQMLSTAEESGSLAPVMLRLSTYYNRELDRLLQRFSKMVEPIMLVFMGVMVGILVSAMILPIFKLSHAVA